MDLNLDDLFSQGNIQYGNLLTTVEQPTITSQSYQQENMQCGDLLSTAVQSTITSQPYQNTTGWRPVLANFGTCSVLTS